MLCEPAFVTEAVTAASIADCCELCCQSPPCITNPHLTPAAISSSYQTDLKELLVLKNKNLSIKEETAWKEIRCCLVDSWRLHKTLISLLAAFSDRDTAVLQVLYFRVVSLQWKSALRLRSFNIKTSITFITMLMVGDSQISTYPHKIIPNTIIESAALHWQHNQAFFCICKLRQNCHRSQE